MNDEPVNSVGREKPEQFDLLRRTAIRRGAMLAYTLPLVLASIQASQGAALSVATGTTGTTSTTGTTDTTGTTGTTRSEWY